MVASDLADLARLATAVRQVPLGRHAYALDADDGSRDVLHADYFDSGARGRLHAGVDPARRPGAYKHILVGPAPPPGPPGTALPRRRPMSTAAEVINEVLAMRQAGSPMAEGLRVLVVDPQQPRPPGGEMAPAAPAASVYLAMRAMRADLLGCVNELARLQAPVTLRLAVVRLALEQLLDHVATMHARGVVHADIRAENVFCGRGPDNDLVICPADFGKAHRGTPAQLAELAADDVRALGRVGLMLFVPQWRPTLSRMPAAALAEAERDQPQLAAALRRLMTCTAQPQQALRRAQDDLARLPAGDEEGALQFYAQVRHKGQEIRDLVQGLVRADLSAAEPGRPGR